jgi:hypothetical protein
VFKLLGAEVSGTDKGSDDGLFDSHPDLADPAWRKTAKRAAREARPPTHREMRRRWAAIDPVSAPPPRRRVRPSWLVTGLVLLVMIGTGLWWRSGAQAANTVGSAGVIPLSTQPPSDTVTTEGSTPLDLNQPFANTPAAGWGDGANGIVLPPPVAVPGWTTAQVATAESQVRQVLIAAHLDTPLLINHDPSHYLALLAHNVVPALQRDLADPKISHAAGAVTQLASGFRLLPAPIKVSGTMSDSPGPDGNILIHANYVFAFPFVPAHPSTIRYSWEIVAIHHVQEDFEVISDGRYRGVWPQQSQGYMADMACGPSNQGYLAPAYSEERFNGPANTEDPSALYNPSHDLNITDTCAH